MCVYFCIFTPWSKGRRGIVVTSVHSSLHLFIHSYDLVCLHGNSWNTFQNFLKLGQNILWVSVSDKFDDGYRSSLNMHIIDQKVTDIFALLNLEVIFTCHQAAL